MEQLLARLTAFWTRLAGWWRRRGSPGLQAWWDGLRSGLRGGLSGAKQRLATRSPSTRKNSGTAGAIGWLRDTRLGWLLLLLSLLYGLLITLALLRANGELARQRSVLPQSNASSATSALRWPIIGAGLPQSEQNLAGAKRDYRKGVSQGFVLTQNDAGVPIGYGQPVLAAAAGEVLRLDRGYRELSSGEFQALLRRVRGGASNEDLDRLRGRQVWLRHPDGRTTRYGHLASLPAMLRVGDKVAQGQIIGLVGNSGLADGVRGSTSAARLLFEVWDGPRFLGQGLNAEGVRIEARDQIQGWP
jgi:peptidoglycan LD-endopeptidase LytH